MEPTSETSCLPIAAAADGQMVNTDGTTTAVLSPPAVSVVMPCLNEADTLAACIGKAHRALSVAELAGEIIIADNGSTDGSQEIARQLGARVVEVPERGYGGALMGGIAAARAPYVIMGDADDSYDFGEVPAFVRKLDEGYDLVQGCRLERGGGTVMPGAMPVLHRWWGNPMFSLLARWWFKAPINDVYCGLRGFRKDFYDSLGQRCTGMEFATEMILKATMGKGRIAEIPITLHPDGRKSHQPHLRTFRDGWRTLRFFLVYSPRWLFWMPGLLLITLGLGGYGIALPGLHLGGLHFDAHTLLFSSLALICGYQSVLFAVLTKVFAVSERLLPPDPRVEQLLRNATLEKSLIVSVAAIIIGFVLLGGAVLQWQAAGWSRLDYASTMRWVIPGVTVTVLGFQTVLASFFLSVLGLARR